VALTIENPEIEQLATEVATMAGESATEAIRRALVERKDRLIFRGETPDARLKRWNRFLETRVWPQIKPEYLGKAISKEEQDEILGYGPDGV